MALSPVLERPTPYQFAAAIACGQTYECYVAEIRRNGDKLRRNYEAFTLTPPERSAIARINKPLRLLAIVEEWCPDVITTLPVMARIAEANPAIQLHILYRPDHDKLANAFLEPVSNRSHIPTYVLIDENGREVAVLIERTPAITAIIGPVAERIRAELAQRSTGVQHDEVPADQPDRLTVETQALRKANLDLERASIVEWFVEAAASA